MNSIICEGKTTEQALENGLKILKVSKDKVNIKLLENEDKRSFFSILAPRIVKLELTLKEGVTPNNYKNKPERNTAKKEVTRGGDSYRFNHDEQELKEALEKIKQFMDEFIKKLPSKEINVTCSIKDFYILVEIKGSDVNYLIGYRGETLNSLQLIVSSIVNKKDSAKISAESPGSNSKLVTDNKYNKNDVIKVIVDIEGYREKRETTLNELAEKISKTVIRTGKSITLEPMSAYERKIIHSKLQEKDKIKTYSVGEEPYRKIVVTLK